MTEREIFIAALRETDPGSRAAVLEACCGADGALRAGVEALLHEHASLGNFLEPPADGIHSEDATAQTNRGNFPGRVESPGTLIGHYKLLEQIGEGGFGIVFMAEQQHPIRRKVAVKVLKPGMDTRAIVTRFEAERQAMAMMDHPNIAHVWDGGESDCGRPYFVMELVRGVCITQFCDEQQLSLRERLELFISVCKAVQHAHQKGVIHRDLKPSNILVTMHDTTAVPKVIDFGIAKAIDVPLTDKTMFTNFAQMIGTPLYMSPEQAVMSGLDLDTRSDIYSLGVLLYELLTGTTPFATERLKDAGYDEIRRIIREEEPAKPSTRISTLGQAASTVSAQRRSNPARLRQLIRGELDWIVMKALEKDRNRRYDSASAFAADLRRYLQDEPVLACPPSAIYKVRKFVRRNRPAVVAAALVLTTLVAGIVSTTVGLLRARQSEAEAIVERNQKQTALDNLLAEQQKSAAALAAKTLARNQAYSALRTLNDDRVIGLLSRQGYLGAAEKTYLRKVVSYFDQLAREAGNSPDAWKIQGDGYWLAARIQVALGDTQQAETAYREALETRVRLLNDAPGDLHYQCAVAECQIELGLHIANVGRHQEAEIYYRDAIDSLTRLATDRPNDAYVCSLRSRGYDRIGLLLQATGRHREAETAFQEAVAACRQIVVNDVNSIDQRHCRFASAEAQGHLAQVLARKGQISEANTAHREATAVWQKLVADYPEELKYRHNFAASHLCLGVEFAETGRVPEAETAFREFLKQMRELNGAFPSVPSYRQQLASGLGNLGTLLAMSGRIKPAEDTHREALKLARQLVDEFPDSNDFRHQLALAHFNLAHSCRQAGLPREAETEYREAIAIQTLLVDGSNATPEFRLELARSYLGLGLVHTDAKRTADAEAIYRKALLVMNRLVEERPGVHDYAVTFGAANCNLGLLFQSTGRVSESLVWFEQAIAAIDPAVKTEPNQIKARLFLRNSHAGRAGSLGKLNRFAEAVRDWDRAIELSAPSQRPMVQIDRALCLARAGEPARATQAAEEILATPKISGSMLYDSACVFALSAEAAKADAELREAHEARAVAILTRAQSVGWFKQPANLEQLKKDNDLRSLRKRDDYRKLLEELGN